ncbi:complex I intermediate-associated protein 30-domain-containing protein [Chytriomyces sp. MP71]|nr:complex I intermediate-associated protein 30-domain-containing protein [Chytriomyces sp. MP71]
MDKSVYTLTPANLDTISFVASSMFGQQLGTFRVTLDSVSLARSDRLALFGAGASWRPGSWRVVDDRVQVGRSVGEIGFVEKGRVLKFTGVLKFRENDGNPSEKRAYASIVSDRRLSPQKSASAPLWNLSAYSQITVSIAKGDGKWYSLNLLTTTDPTTQHRFHFQTKDGSASTHTVQFSDLVPTRQGKRVSNVHSFDPTTVAAISLKCSSLFGKHNGAFALLVSGIIVGIDLDLSEMDSLAWVHNEL